MRHGKRFNHLGRKVGHRKALLKNLAIALITHKRISTTLAKAKALRKFIEPLATKSKTNTIHNRRVVFSYLQNKEAVGELFETIAPKIADRPGGYVRVIKMGFRRSDGAEMALIEFVDFNDVYKVNDRDSDQGKKKRRRRRGGKGGSNVAAPAAEEVVEEVIEEAEEVIEDAEEVIEEAEEAAEPAAEAGSTEDEEKPDSAEEKKEA